MLNLGEIFFVLIRLKHFVTPTLFIVKKLETNPVIQDKPIISYTPSLIQYLTYLLQKVHWLFHNEFSS